MKPAKPFVSFAVLAGLCLSFILALVCLFVPWITMELPSSQGGGGVAKFRVFEVCFLYNDSPNQCFKYSDDKFQRVDIDFQDTYDVLGALAIINMIFSVVAVIPTTAGVAEASGKISAVAGMLAWIPVICNGLSLLFLHSSQASDEDFLRQQLGAVSMSYGPAVLLAIVGGGLMLLPATGLIFFICCPCLNVSLD